MENLHGAEDKDIFYTETFYFAHMKKRKKYVDYKITP